MSDNITKIKYIHVLDKLYDVTYISIHLSSIEARETELYLQDVNASEVFDLSDLKNFRIVLKNYRGQVIDMAEWKEKHI